MGGRNSIIIRKESGRLKGEYSCNFLCDLLHLETAEAIGEYGKDFYEGRPCVTKNDFGKGFAYYLGTEPEERFLRDFVDELCEKADIHPVFESVGKVEICVRENAKGKVIFLINQSEESAMVELGEETYEELLTGQERKGTIHLNSRDVVILKKR